jgi:hypothetical protein
MAGLDVPHSDYVGRYRGDNGHIQQCEVKVGDAYGIPAMQVADELKQFEDHLQCVIVDLDVRYALGSPFDADGLAGVIDLAAWVHSEWIRIHPFANGNGRTARLWANAILMRYGVPPVVTLRPRPNHGYEDATVQAMCGNWQATSRVFHELLFTYLTNRSLSRS